MDSIPPKSNVKAPESYDNIRLSAEEEAEALLRARERKHYRLVEEEKEARAAELRRMLTEQWSTERTRQWIGQRISGMFPGQSISFQDTVDQVGKTISNAGSIFDLLCEYFSADANFVLSANRLGVEAPDLRKGLLLVGNIGCGKTSLMRIFQRNQRQVYMMQGAKEIAWNWRQADKDAGAYMERLCQPHLLPINDSQNFYHRFAGLCIDDVGTEDVQNSFGNRASVIADVIEGRHYNRCAGPLLHLTTNLTMGDLNQFYGARVISRLCETINVIWYKGEDRRK